MTALLGGFAWVLSAIPVWAKVLACIGIFLLIYALILRIVSGVRRRDIPNKRELLNAIADYETKARNAFLAKDQGYANQYLNASEFLSQEHLKSGLTKIRDNPITQMVIFAGFHLSLRHGGIVEISPRKSLSLDKYSFVGRLRGKAEKAIAWVNAVAR